MKPGVVVKNDNACGTMTFSDELPAIGNLSGITQQCKAVTVSDGQ
jgi:hypothetical protein